jgi:drug/metabolite transporter (DMT)-like permease
MCVIWGLPYLFIRIAVEHITPGALVFLRTALGTVVLLPLALARRQVRPVLRRWRWLATFAVVEVITPWLLLSDAERHLNSSLAGLLVAAVPLIGAILAWFSRGGDRLTGVQFIGLLIGLAGVAALVGIDFGNLNLVAVGEMAVVAVCYATGPIVLARRLADLPSLGVIACSLTLSAVVTAPFPAFQPPNLGRASVVLSVAVLGVVCTALAFILFFQLIATIGPTRSTIITYINPAVAVLLGVLVLNENLTTGMLVGFPLILFGSILGARAGSKPLPADRVPVELSPVSRS